MSISLVNKLILTNLIYIESVFIIKQNTLDVLHKFSIGSLPLTCFVITIFKRMFKVVYLQSISNRIKVKLAA